MLSARRVSGLVALLWSAPLVAQQPGAAPVAPTGRITGRVVDRETARPLQLARIVVVGVPGVVETDLDGRYRTPSVAAGVYGIRAALIGFRPVQRDSVQVLAGQAVTVDFAMSPQVIELEELAVETEAPSAPRTDAGLLAAQQAAPGISDGISAEAISRSPDADGGDVVRRVTGVSVFDRKFVIVRGLSERYSTTQLNGSDLPSPEPLKKVAPLDIFPASLIESIITTKSATPDKPGDFAGGSVEIRTKEFPENFTLQLGITQGFNSQTTFQPSRVGPRTTADLFGFGDSRRRPSRAALTGPNPIGERAMESFRNVWTGHRESAPPNLGFNVNLGGTLGESSPVGYILSVTYGNRRQFTPDRLLAFRPELDNATGNGRVLDESVFEVEWGAIANFSLRLGGSSKLGWKNLYTRGAEETFVSGTGYNTENGSVFNTYGVGYVERELLQTQLSGEHLLAFLANTRLEWKGSLAWAKRREPDNRRASYTTLGGEPSLFQNNPFQVRDLEDRVATGQADLTIPWALRRSGDAAFKIGGLLRDKPRKFTSGYFQATTAQTDETVRSLPPEQAFAPENVGSVIQIQRFDAIGADYESDDDLTAFYGMADVPVLPRVRLVGGLRVEHWRITVFNGTREMPLSVLYRRPWDYLWSGNLTLAMSDQMNLRFGAWKSVTRPDPRELVADRYQPVAQECDIVGDTTVTDARITNGDVRWEYYPRPGEVFAVSGFYKKFDAPLVEVVGSGASTCASFTANGTAARNYGVELEARRALDFLPGFLGKLSLGVNATIVESSVDLDSLRFGNAKGLPLQGQSPVLLNGTLSWAEPDWGTSVSLLFNYFDTRVARYGSGDPTQQDRTPPVNVLEEGRYTLDFKMQQTVGLARLSFSGSNLTNQPIRWSLDGSNGRDLTRRSRTGTSWSLAVSYDLF